VKSIIVAAVAGVLATGTAAQDPGGVIIEMVGDAGRGQWCGSQARSMAEAYLREKGWVPGSNDGGRFIVALEDEAIPCGPDNPNFGECRRLAFGGAMMQAKQRMARYLSAEVSTAFERAVRQQISQPTPENLGIDATAAEGMSEEMLALLGGSVPPAPATGTAPAADARQPLLSQQLQSAIDVKARTEVSSLQAYRTFESVDASGRGQIAVIAVYSNRSHDLRNSLVGRVPAVTGTPGPRIGDWVASLRPDELLYMFGPQYRFDERGNLVLIGFGQSVAVSNTGLAEQIARERAETLAIGALRDYLGELVASEAIDRSGVSVEQYVDGGEKIQNAGLFISEIKAEAEKLDMKGIMAIHSWSATHPQSDRPTAGVVVTLSVADALRANALRERFQREAGSRGGRGIAGQRPASAQSGAGGAAQQPGTPPRRPGVGSGGAGASGGEP
jgi:hypothetical protein